MRLVREHINNEAIKHLKPRSKEELEHMYDKITNPQEKFELGIRDGIPRLVKDSIDFVKNTTSFMNWGINAACVIGNPEIIKMLIDAGADIHNFADFPLRHSSFYGHIEMVKLLIAAGANVNANNSGALTWAVNQNNIKVVKILLDAGAKVTSESLLCVQGKETQSDMLKLLNKYKKE